jgi:hypothetical protein
MVSIFCIWPPLLFHHTGAAYDSAGSMQVLYRVFMFWWLSLPFVVASILMHLAAAAPWLARCCMCCLNNSLESNMIPSHLKCSWGSYLLVSPGAFDVGRSIGGIGGIFLLCGHVKHM